MRSPNRPVRLRHSRSADTIRSGRPGGDGGGEQCVNIYIVRSNKNTHNYSSDLFSRELDTVEVRDDCPRSAGDDTSPGRRRVRLFIDQRHWRLRRSVGKYIINFQCATDWPIQLKAKSQRNYLKRGYASWSARKRIEFQ